MDVTQESLILILDPILVHVNPTFPAETWSSEAVVWFCRHLWRMGLRYRSWSNQFPFLREKTWICWEEPIGQPLSDTIRVLLERRRNCTRTHFQLRELEPSTNYGQNEPEWYEASSHACTAASHECHPTVNLSKYYCISWNRYSQMGIYPRHMCLNDGFRERGKPPFWFPFIWICPPKFRIAVCSECWDDDICSLGHKYFWSLSVICAVNRFW